MTNTKTYNELFNEINALATDGHDILEVVFGDNSNFFLVEGFEPPVGGTVHTAPYLQFKGVMINDFLNNTIYSLTNTAGFTSVFNQKYQAMEKLGFQFSENHQWRLYSK
jgi:hypothetical protein